MTLSKATEYAIRALVYIQLKKTEYTGFQEVAKMIDAPEPYTAKILQSLVRKQILNSSKGPGGGFFLSPRQRKTTLRKIIEIMEGSDIFNRCGFGLKNCSPSNPCPLHDDYSLLRSQYKNLVSSLTIASLAEKIKNGEAVINRLNMN